MCKTLFVSVIAMLALFAAGCGGDKQAAGPSAESGSMTIAVIPKGNSHEFWQSVKAGAERADAELADVTVEFKGPSPEDDVTAQKELFQQKQTKGVNAIGIAPVDGNALGPAIDAAVAEGMTVAVFDSDTSATSHVSFIATDNYAAGRKAGAEMVRLLGEDGGKVIVLRYKAGSISTEKREKGFLDVIGEAANIEVLSSDKEGAQVEKATSQNLLVKFGDQIQGVYTPNESTTTGMMLAMREAGLYAKGVIHVGFDSTSQIEQSIRDDEIKAVVIQDPEQMGYLVVTTLHAALTGKPVEKVIDTGSQLVTKASLSAE